jgi:peptide/nickel transport system permease protein
LVSNFGFFVVRRAINAFVTVILLLALVFALLHILVPSPQAMARIIVGNPHATPGIIASVIKANDLTAPVWVQFYHYLVNVFHGNFGTDTMYHVPELVELKTYLPITLELVVVGQIIGVLIGLYTGAIAASNRNRPADYGMKALYLTTWSAPIFLVGFCMQLVVAYWLNLLPATGVVDPVLHPPPSVTNMPVVDGLIAGNWPYFWSSLQHLILPAFAIAVIGFGLVTRLERASMIDALDRDYVKLAYMKGLSKRTVVWGTAFRNALIPIITLVALLFAGSVGGAVIIEDVFAYHGMGFFSVQAIFNDDYTAILAFTTIVGISVIAANFVADLLYAAADPRVRLT